MRRYFFTKTVLIYFISSMAVAVKNEFWTGAVGRGVIKPVREPTLKPAPENPADLLTIFPRLSQNLHSHKCLCQDEE